MNPDTCSLSVMYKEAAGGCHHFQLIGEVQHLETLKYDRLETVVTAAVF